MAFYLVTRLPEADTQLVEAISSKEAAQKVKGTGTLSFIVYQCDKDGGKYTEYPEQFLAEHL